MEFIDKLLEFFGKHVHPAVFAAVVAAVAWLVVPAMREGELSMPLTVIVYGVAFLIYPFSLRLIPIASDGAGIFISTSSWRGRALALPEYCRGVLTYFARNATCDLVELTSSDDLLSLETSGFVRRVEEYGGAARFQLTPDAHRWLTRDYAWIMKRLTASADLLRSIAERKSKALERWSKRWMSS